jgi:hypothetical protein
MEFDEMKKIWDTQNHAPLYAINEKDLHDRILTKKRKATYTTNFTEILGIVVNLVSGVAILGLNLFSKKPSVILFALPVWMILSAAFFWLRRIQRTHAGTRFDRTMRGDLDYAISIATYQVRISEVMRWSILPMATILLASVWEKGKSFWIAVGILAFTALVMYATRWEHGIYKRRKKELETLRSKLDSDAVYPLSK